MPSNQYFSERNTEFEHERLKTQAQIGLEFELPIWQRVTGQNLRVRSWGCGSGHYDSELVQTLPNFGHIEGIDSNAESVEYANQHFGSDRLSFSVGNSVQDTFNPKAVNYARFLLQHLPEEARQRVVQNMADSTIDGGLIILIDYDMSESEQTPSCQELVEMRKIAADRITSNGGSRYVGSELVDYLTANGLQDVINEDASWNLTGENLQRYGSIVVANYRSRYSEQASLMQAIEEWFADPNHKMKESVKFAMGRKS